MSKSAKNSPGLFSEIARLFSPEAAKEVAKIGDSKFTIKMSIKDALALNNASQALKKSLDKIAPEIAGLVSTREDSWRCCRDGDPDPDPGGQGTRGSVDTSKVSVNTVFNGGQIQFAIAPPRASPMTPTHSPTFSFPLSAAIIIELAV
jgi:hypothetical protein